MARVAAVAAAEAAEAAVTLASRWEMACAVAVGMVARRGEANPGGGLEEVGTVSAAYRAG